MIYFSMRLLTVLKTRKGKPINFAAYALKIKQLCRKHHIDLLYLFGSYASGKLSNLSDLDIAFYSKHSVDEFKVLPELQALFEEEAIDFVNLKNAPLPLIHRVLKGKCLYVSSLNVKIEFETHIESLYFDTAHLREEYFVNMMERIEHGAFGT